MFDRVIMVDWSGGKDRGPRPKADAIWIGEAGRLDEALPQYLRNRQMAEAWLTARFAAAIEAGERLLVGFDFPFGYPNGTARQITGSDDPFRLWDHLDQMITDAPAGSNRWQVAGALNALFPGIGPFWGNGGKADVAGLPRKGRDRVGHGRPERRQVEIRLPGTFSCWQLAGAGAVGSQILTGLPVLARLRRRFGTALSVWPFEPASGQIVLAEIWPSLINATIRSQTGPEDIRDAVQVRVMARAFARLDPAELRRMLAVQDREEGWILGLDHEKALRAAAAPMLPDPPPLSDDCFALPPGVDWTPVAEAVALLKAGLRRVVGPEKVPLTEACGRVLTQAVTARRAHPPLPNSAVDGFGFAHAATGPGPQRLPLAPGRAAAGQPHPAPVPAGAALRILTGAALPEGVDTVVLEEDCAVTAHGIAFHGPIKPGANTRPQGEDVAVGDTLFGAGRRLSAPDLALLSAAGHGAIPVFRPLRVALMSTGDELAEPGQATRPDQVPDANRPMLAALLRRWGHVPVDLGRVADDPQAVRAAFDRAAEADAILTSGGASAGDEDHVSALLRAEGQITSWRIALKPGRPLALGLWRGTPIFGLPGNPVAAFVCTLLFARPSFEVLAGARWTDPQAFEVPAAFAKSKKAGRSEYLRARLTADGSAELFASEGSGRISGLAWAEGLVELGPEARKIAPGDPVRFLPYGSFGL